MSHEYTNSPVKLSVKYSKKVSGYIVGNRMIILTYRIDDDFLLARIVGLGVHLDVVDHAGDHGLEVVGVGLGKVD